MNKKTCSFIGHRKIELTDKLKQKLKVVIEDLIVNQNVLTFLFGSRSEFNTLCHNIVTELKDLLKTISKNEAFKILKEKHNLTKSYIYNLYEKNKTIF